VRQIRIIGLCLAAVFVIAAVAATSASAKKDPYTTKTWTQYKYCPYEQEQEGICYVGRTSGGSQGGFFQFGKINVKLNQPIVLQGGAYNSGNGENFVTPATNGGSTLEAPELKVTNGLRVITPLIQAGAEWPQALKESFAAAVKSKESAMYVKIEVAGGNLLYETLGALSAENLVAERGDAFQLPLKVKITGPWLTKLGGGPCYVGNDANPVWQHLTTEAAGSAGSIEFNEVLSNIELKESTLVDLGWHIEPGSAPSGCGGEYESYVDNAIGKALEINPWKTGITVLKGDLFIAATSTVKESAEKGEL